MNLNFGNLFFRDKIKKYHTLQAIWLITNFLIVQTS